MKPQSMPSKYRRRRHLSFDPNHEFIADAVEQYLKTGGEIKVLEPKQEADKQAFWLVADDNLEADEFLND